MMSALLYVTTVDLSLGRVDKNSLSHQTLMELLIEKINNKEKILRSEDDPVRRWRGVTCDSTGSVKKIVWPFSFKLSGELSLNWLPPSLKWFMVTTHHLKGIVNTEDFPEDLVELDIAENTFSGSLNLEILPESLELFSVGDNSFDGTIDLEHLPSKMTELFLFKNRFVGTISLTNLPPKLLYFSISWNQLVGTLDLTRLPDSLVEFRIAHNLFSGSTDLSSLSRIIYCDVSHTYISGTIIVTEGSGSAYTTTNSQVKIVSV